jgi:peptidyl-prolyl cis-trans isomerase A (cyclophilin A)
LQRAERKNPNPYSEAARQGRDSTQKAADQEGEEQMKRFAPGFLALATVLASAASAQTNPPAKRPVTTAHSSTAAKPSSSTYDKALLNPALLRATAPAEYDVKFTTTKGSFTVHVTRDWAPVGADRFYNLVKHRFYDGAAIFRVVPNFMAQFGISPYPAVAKAWDKAAIKDDPVKHGNTRGAITFAAESDANTRDTEVFINFRNNSYLDSQRFAAFGEVTEGMEVVDQLYGGYGDSGAPDQGKMTEEGRAYTEKNFPKLDIITTAVVVAPGGTTAPKAAPKTPPHP